jgi:phosphoglycolate phosphatase
MQLRAVLFDLDGTLLYTIGDIANAINRVLLAHGREPKTEEEYRSLVGWGIQRLVESCLPEEERTEERVSQYSREVVDAYHAEPTVRTEVYPGIEQVLDELNKRSVPCAALSNKLDSLTRVIIDTVLGLHRFRVVQGALAGVPKKPDPTAALDIVQKLQIAPEHCLFVGDTAIDMETARNAGMPACAVTWGYRPRPELEDARPDWLIERPEEILSILDNPKSDNPKTASPTGGV